jgi:AcrR family transcriptional regulator
MAAKAPTQPLREKLREATWSAIVDAAEYVAAEQGMAGASVQAIAERAGTAVGTIYNYFHDKDQLFDALFTRRKEELYSAIDAAAKRCAREPFERQLEAFVRSVFEYFDARRAFLRIAFEVEKPQIVKGADGRKRPAAQQLQERAERVVRVGLREKRLREDAADLLATLLVSIVRGVLIARNLDDRPFLAETERVVSLFLGGAGK